MSWTRRENDTRALIRKLETGELVEMMINSHPSGISPNDLNFFWAKDTLNERLKVGNDTV